MHRANAAEFLTDGQGRFTLPDGTSQDAPMNAAAVIWDAGGEHLPENLGDEPFEVVVIELTSKPAAGN